MTTPLLARAHILYGSSSIPLRLPPTCRLDVARREGGETSQTENLIAKAIANQLASQTLGDILKQSVSPLIVVNDATRSTPTEAALDAIMPYLSAAGGWRIIVATGLHRAPSEAELKVIFGHHLETVRPRLLIHDGYDKNSFEVRRSDGVSIELNKAVFAADRLILINSVEPHFFAGYTGGRKSIIPGLAGFDTVERSHAGAMQLSAAPLKVAGNPVREFIHRHTGFLDPERVFSIQAVLDRDNKVAAAFAGDIDKTFTAACEVARKHYVVRVARRYDIVVAAVHPPLDVSLYQAHKGWELTQEALRDGGCMILTAECREGIGSSFYARRVAEQPDPEQWPLLEGSTYVMGLHKLVRKARARARFHLMAVTGILPEEVARYGYEPHTSLDSALNAAIARTSNEAHILVVEDAALTTVTVD